MEMAGLAPEFRYHSLRKWVIVLSGGTSHRGHCDDAAANRNLKWACGKCAPNQRQIIGAGKSLRRARDTVTHTARLVWKRLESRVMLSTWPGWRPVPSRGPTQQIHATAFCPVGESTLSMNKILRL
jgi:hypothetical protein